MTTRFFLQSAIVPAMSLLPGPMDSAEARALILAICLQESRLQYRRQQGGPARSFAQFERGGIAGVLQHPASSLKALAFCDALNVLPSVERVYEALEFQDVLCAGFSRLLLWTSPSALPGPHDAGNAWALYLQCWRPGKPHKDTWAMCFSAGWDAVLRGRTSPPEGVPV